MKKSFSLIELLIVVTIIAVLTGAALPFVGEYLEQSKTAKAKNDLDEISRAINAFEVTTGLAYSDTTGNVLKGRFLQKLPIDPWGIPYGFASANEDDGCTVYSAGPDHVAGTVDDISVAYKGPLAIVSAKWQDVNNDGAISGPSAAYPSSDTLIIRFNRKSMNQASWRTLSATNSNYMLSVGSTTKTLFGLGQWVYTGTVAAASCTLTTDGRTLIFQLKAAQTSNLAWVLGSSTLWMTTRVLDAGGKPGVPASVTILAN